MKIKTRLIVTLSGLSCVILALGLSSIISVKSLDRENEKLATLNELDLSLYKARLAQADYLGLEQSRFAESAKQHILDTHQKADELKGMFSEPQKIKKVDSIITNITAYEKSFDDLLISKTSDIEGKAQFDIKAAKVVEQIDKVLLSIEVFYKANRDDFEEFNRYMQAKAFKDSFNEIRVAVWKFNERSTPERVQGIENHLSALKQMINPLRAIMLGEDTQNQLNVLDEYLIQYGDLFKKVKAANENVDEGTSGLLVIAQEASGRIASLVEEETIEIQSLRTAVNNISLAAIFVALVASAIAGLWLTRSIAASIKTSNKIASYLSKGDLSFNVDVNGNDELAHLNRSLIRSIDDFRKTIVQVSSSLSNLDAIGREVETSVKNSQDSIFQQQNQTDALATAIEEMTRSSQQITQSAKDAAQRSADAEEQAKKGEAVVSKAQTEVENLSSELNHSSQIVEKLNEDSKNIAEIIEVIKGIAEQTNLLALNAAIEAARAGDQGRGFAVVADEVRQLAKRTQDSTSQITEIVEMVQNGAKEVNSAMESSNSVSSKVLEYTNSASQAYSNIKQAIDQLAQINVSVKSGAEEQTSTCTHVNNSVLNIRDLAVNNSQTQESIQTQIYRQTQESEACIEKVALFKI